ncbi:transcriptional regulator [Allonocardiopsis opalescens]|uniref:Uncharacterized protein n=1 Tax=Allonocardiopsis opalescens TaxID=1144618 RepID=A0A2T0PXG1_9ACTN|nr:transcriptional regulator [Allonocardiopsis opalescens]PRX96227.1 hypothetical protein CLV72_108234 [Allonocardiopsis opalescens]
MARLAPDGDATGFSSGDGAIDGPADGDVPVPDTLRRATEGDTADDPPDGEDASDLLVAELTAELPELIRQEAAEGSIRDALRRDRIDPALLTRTAVDDVDGLLRLTNPEITAIRAARAELAAHEQVRDETGQARPEPVSLIGEVLAAVGFAGLGLALWLGPAVPVLMWRSWIWLDATGEWSDTLLVLGIAGLLVVVLAYLLFRTLGRLMSGRRSGEFARGGVTVVLGIALACGYLLALWRLADDLGRNLTGWPPGLAPYLPVAPDVLVWIVGGGLALVIAVGFVTTGAETMLDAVGGPENERLGIAAIAVAQIGLGTLCGISVYFGLTGQTGTQPVPEQPLADATAVPIAAGAALAMAAGVIPAVIMWWTSQSTRRNPESAHAGRGEAWQAERRRLDRQARTALAEWRRAVREKAVRPLLLRRLNELLDPPFSVELGELNAPGLRQMRAKEYLVTTSVFAEFRRLLGQIGGGAVGVAGPRGAGKSTLLEAYREGSLLDAGKEHLALFESVPVRYDAREFALHLYAGVCRAVLDFADRHPERGGGPAGAAVRLSRTLTATLLGAVALAATAWLSAALVAAPPSNLGALLGTAGWQLGLLLAALVALAVLTRRRPPAPGAVRARDVRDLAGLRRLAEEKQEAIRFQQRYTSGWSGKLALPFGTELGRTGSVEYARQVMTYPEVVYDLRETLEAAVRVLGGVPSVAETPVAIVLDELDKILVPEQAQEFVNEIKALFSIDVPGCLFLVSVSEDALAAFERRGLPVRDAFDSAFDAVFPVEYLGLAEARELLRGRVIGLGEPFVCLCHCMAGGLPRELVRVARSVVVSTERSLGGVCRELVGRDLRAKVGAMRTVIARNATVEPFASELMRHLDAHARPDHRTLLAAAAAPPEGPARPGDDARAEEHAVLERLRLEALGYLYYCATLLEVFGDGLTEQRLELGRTASGTAGEARPDASFDTLASVRQLFAVNARLAWLTVSAFRAAWGLETVPPPPVGTAAASADPS